MYAELRARTHFSFLRGASSPDEMVGRAAELGLRAIGIVDRNGVYGIPKAFRALQTLSKDLAGPKRESSSSKEVGEKQKLEPRTGATEAFKTQLITGAELTLEGEIPPLTLLAVNRAGYGLMCRMLTASHEGRDKGTAALAWPRFLDFCARHPSAREGLIALPEAGPVGDEFYGALRELFPGRTYLPLSRFLDGFDLRRTTQALQLSRRYGLPLVATNDAHFHVPARRVLHDVVTSIRELKPLEEIGHLIHSNAERYLKSAEQMMRLFRDQPQAVLRTCEVAERCTFSPGELRYRYPSEWIPVGHTAQSFLEELTDRGAQWRYPDGVPANVIRQLKHELALIQQLEFADYFITIWEIVDYAVKKDILCQGRGSAANSAVCYCLGITAIDPVRMNLLFERFLSAERGEPPDIDVDFEHERREEVIQHIYEKYGRDRAAMVSAVITYRTRLSLREIAKTLGVPPELAGEDPRVRALSEEIKGFPRHLSIHSGGFTLSADPIIEVVPVEPARMENRTIIQWDKEDLAIIGLIKVDILALGMLSAMKKTFDGLRVRTYAPPVDLTIARTPAEDPATYAMIQNADTIGVFQIESRAQMGMLGRLLPKTFYDLVIEVAIVRPGPIVGQMVHPYLRRRRGLESSKSPDPRLEPILGRTLGVPLFQEQVMQMAITMAGFTPGEADELRRAVNAWKSKGSIEKMGRKLMAGLLASGLPQEFVERIFLQIQGFAEYGFPESHAASFALLAYVSSYLKCHFPAEFTIALVNSQPMGFYSSHTLIEDARRHGVTVRPVDPNRSEWDCTMEAENVLRVGLRVVNGMMRSEADALIAARRERPFADVSDFLSRTRLRPQVLQRLAMGGAFECFGLKQRDSLWRILGYAALFRSEPGSRPRTILVEAATSEQTQQRRGQEPEAPSRQWRPAEQDAERRSRPEPLWGEGELGPHRPISYRVRPAPTRVRETTASSGQLNLFSGVPLDSAIPSPPPAAGKFEPLFTSLTAYEAIEADYESYGLSVRGHPMEALRKAAAARGQSHLIPPTTTGTLRRLAESQPDTASRRSGPIVRVAGLVIVRQRPGTAKGVAFATLEDEAGFLDLIVLKPVFEQYQDIFTNEPFLRVAGRLQRDSKAINLIVTEISALDPEQILGASVAPSRREPQELYDEQRLKDLREIRMKSRDFR